jgi:ATP-dependent Lhr-like helicase
VLVVGPTTEREYGRGHYRDLMASFSSSPMLQGRHGTSEIGLIDPTSLLSREELPTILLSGRSWRVLDVDWRKGVAWLEPTTISGKARWQGSARDVSCEAAEALRQVLQAEDPPAELSRRAKSQLEELRATTPVGEGTKPVWSRDGGYTQLWTFAGTRTNRTVARGLPAMAHRTRYDELMVEWEGPPECIEQLPTVVASPSDEELDALAESVKFSQLMPRWLFARLVRSRLWDTRAEHRTAPSPLSERA